MRDIVMSGSKYELFMGTDRAGGSPYLKIAHILGAVAQFALVVTVAIALNSSNTDEIIARSTVLSVHNKPSFPKRIIQHDIFGKGWRLKPGKTYHSLIETLGLSEASCSHTSCCAGAGYSTIADIPLDDIVDCYDETDRRWSDTLAQYLLPPGYNILVLVLMAPIISGCHHLWAALNPTSGYSVIAKYADYSVSASFILIVLYQLAMVFSFATQLLGFFSCALSMWFAYKFETTTDTDYFWLGSILHGMAWVPFFINLGQLMSYSDQLEVQTVDVESTPEDASSSSETANNTGIGLAVGGSIAIYLLYPLITYKWLSSPSLQYYHTVLSVAAKTVLVAGVLQAVEFR